VPITALHLTGFGHINLSGVVQFLCLCCKTSVWKSYFYELNVPLTPACLQKYNSDEVHNHRKCLEDWWFNGVH